MSTTPPSVLFVCVKNGGKSQMAAALMRQIAGDAVTVHSAGTKPGPTLNAQSLASVEEVGASMEGEHPKPIDPALLDTVDVVVLVGGEATIEQPGTAPIRVWETVEPSKDGIEGMERMRLVREDITRRVVALALELTGEPAEHAQRYEEIVQDLTYQYKDTFTPEQVRAAVRHAHARLAPGNRVPSFLPVLVERFATQELLATAQAKGLRAKRRPELLFVCVQNAGRSQMAAAMASHLSGGRVNVRSAGSRPADELNATAVEVLRERGIELTDAYPKPLSDDVVRAADVVITMGCGDECPYFPGRRYEDWEVADPAGADISRVRDIADDIQVRVTKLLREVLD